MMCMACCMQAQGNASEQAMLQQQLDPLMRVAKAHAKGKEEYARSIVHEILSQFADVEEMFQTTSGVTTEQVRIGGICLSGRRLQLCSSGSVQVLPPLKEHIALRVCSCNCMVEHLWVTELELELPGFLLPVCVVSAGDD